MTRYVRRPIECDAMQVTPDTLEEVAAWCGGPSRAVVEHDELKLRLGDTWFPIDMNHYVRQDPGDQFTVHNPHDWEAEWSPAAE